MKRLAAITLLALAGVVAACSPATPSSAPGSSTAPGGEPSVAPSTEPSLAPSTSP